MTALRDRSTTARTVDRALAQLTGALKHGGFGTSATTERRGRRRRRTTEIDHVDLKVSAERQRIAGALHDDVSQLLFAMAARARRAHDLHPDDPAELREALRLIAEQLQEAQQRVRGVISACGPTSASDTVPTAAQRDLDDFTDRTGVSADLLVRGRPVHLAPPVERVALSCLRQALFNIERHAHAGLVVVTLDYQPDRLAMIVQDDGRGLPDGFEPRAVPADGHHWGFTSMAEQVERLGGSVLLRRAPDSDVDSDMAGDMAGGTQLRVELPRPAEAR
ncbi:sensor histidine kinase [Pseudonocardia acaciae]|uniref:sensor histidine kinase n=1 Tax=Pseudonocardia acaciae TaxID=551276 RepID=UPI00055A5436|nr:histidine kinase [Pseudonocardia acaciae]